MNARCIPMIAVMTLLAAIPEARAADARLVLRGGVGWARARGSWTGDLLLTEAISVTKLEAGGSTGPRVSIEWRFSRLIGGEVSVLQRSQEVNGSGLNFPEAAFGRVTQRPILFGANFHLTRHPTIDLYLGPVIGWVIWGDLKPSAAAQQEVTIGPVPMHDGFAWGVNVGVDVPFAKHWVFNVDLKDLDYSARTDSRPIKAVLGEDATIPIDPLVATAGFGLRW